MKSKLICALAGIAAGIVNGLFGAGGGMLLVPLLRASGAFSDRDIFSGSLVIILPICLVSLLMNAGGQLPWQEAMPYLIGSLLGGIAAVTFGKKIPVVWLHRILGMLILYGGIRYIC